MAPRLSCYFGPHAEFGRRPSLALALPAARYWFHQSFPANCTSTARLQNRPLPHRFASPVAPWFRAARAGDSGPAACLLHPRPSKRRGVPFGPTPSTGPKNRFHDGQGRSAGRLFGAAPCSRRRRISTRRTAACTPGCQPQVRPADQCAHLQWPWPGPRINNAARCILCGFPRRRVDAFDYDDATGEISRRAPR